MTWWAWMILGTLLLGAEMLAIDAQFYLVFIGLAAMLVGLGNLAGITPPEWVQWLIFSGLSLIFMFTFRKALYQKIHGNVAGFREGVDGDYVVVDADLPAGGRSRLSFRGSDWTVVNEGSAPISSGSRVLITRSEGLTLYVEGS